VPALLMSSTFIVIFDRVDEIQRFDFAR